MAKTGWNAPLVAQFNMNRFELASSMQAGFDNSGLRRKTGRLRAALGTQRNYRQISGTRGGVRIQMNIPLPYAAIQDQGGVSPPVEGKLMRMPWGYRRRRKASRIKGSNYLEAGLDAFCKKYGISGGGFTVKWK